jgi:hypothetical protein
MVNHISATFASKVRALFMKVQLVLDEVNGENILSYKGGCNSGWMLAVSALPKRSVVNLLGLYHYSSLLLERAKSTNATSCPRFFLFEFV